MSDAPYANVRELIPIEGLRVVMVTQHDEMDWIAGDPAFISLHFENGMTLTIYPESGLIHFGIERR